MALLNDNSCRSSGLDEVAVDEVDVATPISTSGGTSTTNGSSTKMNTNFILQISVHPFALLPYYTFSTALFIHKFKQQQPQHVFLKSDLYDDEKIEYQRMDDFTTRYDTDVIHATVRVWKEQLSDYMLQTNSSIKDMKRDSLVSFEVVMSAVSLWIIAFLTLFEMMQIQSVFYINVTNDWICIFRLLFICVELFLLFQVLKKYEMYRQSCSSSHGQSNNSGIEKEHLWVQIVLKFMIAMNTVWLASYIVGMVDEQDIDRAMITLPVVLFLVFIILLSITTCIHLVCDINCFHDKSKRNEVLQQVCDEIIAMNDKLVELTCQPIIRSYHSDISVYMFDKNNMTSS
jgi:hypothetical protein